MASWLRRRFGLHTRRVAVYSSVSAWLPRFLIFSLAAVAFATLLWLGWQKGWFASNAENHTAVLRALASQMAELERSNAALKSEVSVLERQIQIERATYTDLLRQVKELGNENARLREDNALLEAISAADAGLDEVRVSSVRIRPNAVPGEYSYRFVLVQTGSRAKPFLGRYDFLVSLDQGGERRLVTVPGASDASDRHYRLEFRVHQRVEGAFKLPAAAAVQSVQLRVYEGRQMQPKTTQTIKMS